MTSPDPLAPKIEQAVDALLRAIIAAEGSPAGTGRMLIAIDIEEGAITAEDLDAIVVNPVGVACRSEIAALGSLLFDTMGTPDHITDVVHRIAGMDPGHEARRVAILDDVWKQVGSEGDAGWK